MKKKRSFFEKLTGAVRVDDFDEDYIEDEDHPALKDDFREAEEENRNYLNSKLLSEEDGELSVDVINTPNEIIIKSMVAGVKPQDLDINITRDMVTIRGERQEEIEFEQKDYFHRELYWGSFSRNIILPEEVDVELAEAKEKNGLLIIKLPKLDKDKKTKLTVKSL